MGMEFGVSFTYLVRLWILQKYFGFRIHILAIYTL